MEQINKSWSWTCRVDIFPVGPALRVQDDKLQDLLLSQLVFFKSRVHCCRGSVPFSFNPLKPELKENDECWILNALINGTSLWQQSYHKGLSLRKGLVSLRLVSLLPFPQTNVPPPHQNRTAVRLSQILRVSMLKNGFRCKRTISQFRPRFPDHGASRTRLMLNVSKRYRDFLCLCGHAGQGTGKQKQ